MACTTHVLGIHFQHHHWQRSFTGTDTEVFTESDMWGRQTSGEHVICHTRQVCELCGAVGPAAECICDKEKADRCAFRLDGMRNEPA